MSYLARATQHVAIQRSCLQRSYVEISRFVRPCQPRHHGITPRLTTCFPTALRCYSSVTEDLAPIVPDEALEKAFASFKRTVDFSSDAPQDILRPELNKYPIGKEVTATGYLVTRRDVNKKLSFAVLRSRNQAHTVQLVSTWNREGTDAAEAHAQLKTLRDWTPVVVKGMLQERKPPPEADASNESSRQALKMISQREIVIRSILPLNEIPTDVIVKEEAEYGPEQRHLQLRMRSDLRENILQRSRALQKIRQYLASDNWKEIETPLLFKSTPEGAREFLVPTRNKGLMYALPQSPQQYKQILMASGFEKYFQIAKCFRDEDQRADRQPEFTQLDMEISFAGEKAVMETVEELVTSLWDRVLNRKLSTFPRMTYQEAMATYGSDKPDLRWAAKIRPVTEYLTPDLISKITSLENPTVDAFKMTLSSDTKANRKLVSNFLDSPAGSTFLNNPDGQPAIFFGDAAQPMGGMGPLGHRFAMECPQDVAADHGEVLVMQARKNGPLHGGSTMLGNLRIALHKAALAEKAIHNPQTDVYSFLWVTDFPLFSPSNDAEPGQGGMAGLSSTHHPFTAPKTAADVDLLLTDPTKAVAAHYDLVVNGVELGGGSRRIHNADVQEFIFRDILKMRPERVEDFRHLLDVLRSGCPPHAGMALGLDRLIAVMQKTDTVRDVIAFPKSGSGEDPLVKAPSRVTPAQLDTYHLQVKV